MWKMGEGRVGERNGEKMRTTVIEQQLIIKKKKVEGE